MIARGKVLASERTSICYLGWSHVDGGSQDKERTCGESPDDTYGTDSKPSGEHRLRVLSTVTL